MTALADIVAGIERRLGMPLHEAATQLEGAAAREDVRAAFDPRKPAGQRLRALRRVLATLPRLQPQDDGGVKIVLPRKELDPAEAEKRGIRRAGGLAASDFAERPRAAPAGHAAGPLSARAERDTLAPLLPRKPGEACCDCSAWGDSSCFTTGCRAEHACAAEGLPVPRRLVHPKNGRKYNGLHQT